MTRISLWHNATTENLKLSAVVAATPTYGFAAEVLTYTHIHAEARASPIEHLSELRYFQAPFFPHNFVVVFNCHLSHSILIYYYCHFNKYTGSNAAQPPWHGGGFDIKCAPARATLFVTLCHLHAPALASFAVRSPLMRRITLTLRFSLGK